MNCDLNAKNIDSPRASLCGGKIIAFSYIEILELGKKEFKKTILEVGGKVNKLRLFGELDKEIEELSNKIAFCKDKINHFKRVTANRTLTPTQEEGIFSFHTTLDLLNDIWEKRVKERDRLREEMNKTLPKVIVNGAVFDNVKMTINDATVQNVSNVMKTTFYEKEGEIVKVKNN
jgi:uncharacterized protein (DUF342 family)